MWVATKEIRSGTSYAQANSDGAFGTREIAQVDIVDGALGDLEPIANQVALSTIYPGEQILLSKFGDQAEASTVFAAMPEGTLAVPVQLAEANKIDSFVLPGQEVAVFVTMGGDGPAGQPFSRLIFARVKVLAVDTITAQGASDVGENEESSGSGEVPLLTLALTQKQSEAVFLCSGGRGALRWSAQQDVERGARGADDDRAAADGDAMTAIVDTDRAGAEMLHSALGPRDGRPHQSRGATSSLGDQSGR